METAPTTLTVPPVITVDIEGFVIFVEIPAPQSVMQGFVIKVEKAKGKLATLTLRLLLVTKVEKDKGKLATLTLRLLLVTKVEKDKGKLATLTLRLLLVTKVEKDKGKLATLTLRLLFVIKLEIVLVIWTEMSAMLTIVETTLGTTTVTNNVLRLKLLITKLGFVIYVDTIFVTLVDIPAPHKFTQFRVLTLE